MSTVLLDIRAAAEAAGKAGHQAEAFNFTQWASHVEQTERELAQAKQALRDMTGQHERLQLQIGRAMQSWSRRLGWGLGGHQPECFALMDASVSELLKLRAGVPLLKSVARRVPLMAPGFRGQYLYTQIVAFLVNRGVALSEIGAEAETTDSAEYQEARVV